jgi:uncharacterized protein (TIGR03790 family)
MTLRLNPRAVGFVLAKTAALVSTVLGGCAAAPAPPVKDSGPASHVLVVINLDSAASKEIGSYYARKRSVPAENVVRISAPETEEIGSAVFDLSIRDAVRAWIRSRKNRIDYIVLTKGVPIRIREGGYSVDGHLAAMDLPIKAVTGGKDVKDQVLKSLNPYFNKREPFDSKKFGFYLVTRLDGYDVAHCLKLVDNALVAKREKGLFLFNPASNRTGGSYGALQDEMFETRDLLEARKLQVQVTPPGTFAAPAEALAGYCSWGSNDDAYKRDAYVKLKFKPGALGETFVSTSGRTFLNRNDPGQSLIGDLIDQGITGVKGYVSEPFTFALAHPKILFDRYTDGYNLAESFYMASMVLKWKDVVIGDPLCSPYKKPK